MATIFGLRPKRVALKMHSLFQSSWKPISAHSFVRGKDLSAGWRSQGMRTISFRLTTYFVNILVIISWWLSGYLLPRSTFASKGYQLALPGLDMAKECD